MVCSRILLRDWSVRTRGNEVRVEVPVELMTMTKRRVLEGLNLHLVPFLLLPLSLWLGCTRNPIASRVSPGIVARWISCCCISVIATNDKPFSLKNTFFFCSFWRYLSALHVSNWNKRDEFDHPIQCNSEWIELNSLLWQFFFSLRPLVGDSQNSLEQQRFTFADLLDSITQNLKNALQSLVVIADVCIKSSCLLNSTKQCLNFWSCSDVDYEDEWLGQFW